MRISDWSSDVCSSDLQLGLVTDDGTLILPVKNATPFSGTQVELLPFLGKRVVADGLFMTNHGYKLFALQFVRAAPDGEWRGANRFLNARSEEHTSELQSLMRISYAVFCLKKKKKKTKTLVKES